MSILRATGLILAIGLTVGCDDKGKSKADDDGSTKSTSSTSKKSAPTAEKTAEADPGSFESTEGKFSAKFPFGAPAVKSEDQKGVAWNKVEAKTGLYNVSYADFPDDAKAKAAMDDYLASMKTEYKDLRDLDVGGAPGKEVVFTISAESTMWLRLVVVGKRFYKVAAGNKNNKSKAYEFLDSFKLAKG